MFTISKLFEFSASHRLSGLPAGHQCARLHGHNYQVQIFLEAEKLDQRGFVMDFGDLKPFKDYIDQNLDHRHLNDILTVNPTAENLAHFLYLIASELFGKKVMSVRVSETPKTWAEFMPEEGMYVDVD